MSPSRRAVGNLLSYSPFEMSRNRLGFAIRGDVRMCGSPGPAARATVHAQVSPGQQRKVRGTSGALQPGKERTAIKVDTSATRRAGRRSSSSTSSPRTPSSRRPLGQVCSASRGRVKARGLDAASKDPVCRSTSRRGERGTYTIVADGPRAIRSRSRAHVPIRPSRRPQELLFPAHAHRAAPPTPLEGKSTSETASHFTATWAGTCSTIRKETKMEGRGRLVRRG